MPLTDRVTLITRLLDKPVWRAGRRTAERQIADFYRRTRLLCGSCTETETETSANSAASRYSVSWPTVREMLVRRIIAVWGYDVCQASDVNNDSNSASTTMPPDRDSINYSSAMLFYPAVYSTTADDLQADVLYRSTTATLYSGRVEDTKCNEDCTFVDECCASNAFNCQYRPTNNSSTEENTSDSLSLTQLIHDMSHPESFLDDAGDADGQQGFILEDLDDDDPKLCVTGEVLQVSRCERDCEEHSNVEVVSADVSVMLEAETSCEVSRVDDDDGAMRRQEKKEEKRTNASDHVTRCSPTSDVTVRPEPQTSSDCADVDISATETQLCEDDGTVQEQNEITSTDHVEQLGFSSDYDVSDDDSDQTDQWYDDSAVTLSCGDQRSTNVSDDEHIQLADEATQNSVEDETEYAATNLSENG